MELKPNSIRGSLLGGGVLWGRSGSRSNSRALPLRTVPWGGRYLLAVGWVGSAGFVYGLPHMAALPAPACRAACAPGLPSLPCLELSPQVLLVEFPKVLSN